MERILVLGATGMLGHVVTGQSVSEGLDVHASVRSEELATLLPPEATIHRFDALSDAVARLVTAVSPSVVINCIGLVKQLDLESDPAPAIRLNALFPHDAASACEAAGARLVHISTDCVFSGSLPLGQAYTENHAPDATDVYGMTKRLGEIDSPHALTLRTSIIGPELRCPTGLLEWLVSQRGTQVNGFTNAIFSGFTTVALARLIGAIVADHRDLNGLYHVAAAPISKYDLLVGLNDALGLEIDVVAVEEPTVNRALDASRLWTATRLVPPSWTEMLEEYASEGRALDLR